MSLRYLTLIFKNCWQSSMKCGSLHREHVLGLTALLGDVSSLFILLLGAVPWESDWAGLDVWVAKLRAPWGEPLGVR